MRWGNHRDLGKRELQGSWGWTPAAPSSRRRSETLGGRLVTFGRRSAGRRHWPRPRHAP